VTRRERSYLLPTLSAADRKLLATLPRQATLADEIDLLRLRLVSLAGDEAPDYDRLLRLLSLLTRMVNVQSKVGDHDTDQLGELIAKIRERLVKAGYKVSPDLPSQPPGEERRRA
jgi:hypothetical protein